MKHFLLTSLALIVLSYGLLGFEGLHDDTISDTEKVMYGVIYGNKVELDGTVSKRLGARLEAGVELYTEELITKIIVSGGTGIEGFDEAEVMMGYLVEGGIPTGDIIVDSDGYTTRMTSENAYQTLGDNIGIIGISQWYHIARVKLSLNQAGFTQVHGVAPDYFELRDIYSLVRELPAYVKYKFGL